MLSIRVSRRILCLALALSPGLVRADAESAARAAAALAEGNFAAVKEACQAGADADDVPCMEMIGRSLLNAKNPERDPKKAIAFLKRAADAGSAGAQSLLGMEHFFGNNAEPNAEMVIGYLGKSAAGGNVAARANLGNLYRDGRLVARDLAKARELYAASTTDQARLGYAEMAFYGEGGPREPQKAIDTFTELARSTVDTVARRAQAGLDTVKKYADAQKWDLAIYLNPYSPDVRRNLEGKLVMRDLPAGQPVALCWPDNFYREVVAPAGAVLPGFDARVKQRFPKAVAEAGIRAAGVRLVMDAGCIRSAPLLVATRGLNAQLTPAITLTLAGDNRDTTQLARVDFMSLVQDSMLEARDRSAQQFNDTFADRLSKWALNAAVESGKLILAAITLDAASSNLSACTLKGDAASAQTIASMSEFWSKRKPVITFNGAAPREFDSPEALFDAVTAKSNACQSVIAAGDVVNRLSTALARDKIAHKVVADTAWTPAGLVEYTARSRGFSSAAQMAFADSIKASPEDLRKLAAVGVSQADELKDTQRRATAGKYPGELATVDAVVQFVEDEAAGKKAKKPAAQIARERSAAEEAARRKQQAADEAARRAEEAARKKSEAAAAEQKKRDDLDRNAERLSEIAGVVGTSACRTAAEDHVSSVAKYSYKWDDLGFLGTYFDKFLVHVETPGVLTMVSNHLSMQNGFGAYKRVKLLCDYDTRAKKALHVVIDDR
jgi:TPR repeat protein